MTTTTTIGTGETIAEFDARLARIGEAIWTLDHDRGAMPRRVFGRAVDAFRAGRYDRAVDLARLAHRSYLRRTS